MPISSEDYAMMQARLNRRFEKAPEVEAINDAVEEEGNLQQQIVNFLNERQWYYVWSPMWARTSTKKGTPDFCIAAPKGRTLWIECKSKTGKSSTEQIGAGMMLKKEGHEHHVVRSYREFCEIVAAK